MDTTQNHLPPFAHGRSSGHHCRLKHMGPSVSPQHWKPYAHVRVLRVHLTLIAHGHSLLRTTCRLSVRGRSSGHHRSLLAHGHSLFHAAFVAFQRVLALFETPFVAFSAWAFSCSHHLSPFGAWSLFGTPFVAFSAWAFPFVTQYLTPFGACSHSSCYHLPPLARWHFSFICRLFLRVLSVASSFLDLFSLLLGRSVAPFFHVVALLYDMLDVFFMLLLLCTI